MFGKKREKMVKITESYYKFLIEKGKERQEYKKEAEYKNWLLELERQKKKLTEREWNLYYDFILNGWYPLEEQDKLNELEWVRTNIARSEDCDKAMTYFLSQLRDLERTKEAGNRDDT